MSLYDRKLPVQLPLPTFPAAYVSALAGARSKCPGCRFQIPASYTCRYGLDAKSVWAALDEDRCPACNTDLRDILHAPFKEKNAIARRLLG